MIQIVWYKRIKDRVKSITLAEIIVVVVMLVLLTALKVPDSNVSRGKAFDSPSRGTAAAMQISNIETALDNYYKHNGFYPTTIQGLKALVSKPTIRPEPKNYQEGGYMKKVPLDSWGNPFIYRNPGEKELGLFDLISCGADGEEGTEDDITNHSIKE